RLRRREELASLGFLDVPRRSRRAYVRYRSGSVVAQDADGDLAVDVDVLHELHEVEVLVEVRQPHDRGIPGPVRLIVHFVQRIEWVQRAVVALGDVAQGVTRSRPA